MSHLGFCLEIAWKSSEEDLRLGVFVMETSWPTPSLCELRLLSQVKGVQAAWTGFGLRWSGGHDVFGDIPACSLMGGGSQPMVFFCLCSFSHDFNYAVVALSYCKRKANPNGTSTSDQWGLVYFPSSRGSLGGLPI